MSGSTASDGERGTSPVGAARKPLLSRRALTVGILAVAGGVSAFVLWKSSNPPEEPVREKLPRSLGSVVPYTAPQMIVPTPTASQPPPVAPRPEPPPQRVIEPAITALPAPRRDPISQVMPNLNIQPPPVAKPYMLSFADPERRAVQAAGATIPVATTRGVMQAMTGGGRSSSIAYAASHLNGAQAGLLGDQTFLLMPQLLPCILDTSVNSTFPGPVQCHLPADVKPRGVVLLGRGSRVHGMYQNNVQTGQARLFVQADWVEDPRTGCFIQFQNTPVSDSLGTNGVPGNVDTHLLERFGAAVTLTFVENAVSLAQAALSKGGNTYLNFNSGGGMESIASAILRGQINIPPTITISQGSTIAVFVTKPLDFSPCYDLKVVKDAGR